MTGIVSYLVFPRLQLPSKDVCSRAVIDDDGDSLADVSSLPSSDSIEDRDECLDENHNETAEDQKCGIVEVQSVVSEVCKVEVATSLTNSTELSSSSLTNVSENDAEYCLPFETCDETVITISAAESDCENDKGVQVDNAHISVCASGTSENEAFSVHSNNESNLEELYSLEVKKELPNVNNDNNVSERNLADLPSSQLSDRNVEDIQVFSDEGVLDCTTVVNITESPLCIIEDDLNEVAEDSEILKETMSLYSENSEEPIETAVDHAACIKPSMPLQEVNLVSEAYEDSSQTCSDEGVIQNFFETSPLKITSGRNSCGVHQESPKDTMEEINCNLLEYNHEKYYKTDIVDVMDDSECPIPNLQSLNTEFKTMLCIGENEKVDMFSILAVNHVGDSSKSVLVEDFVASRSDRIEETVCEKISVIDEGKHSEDFADDICEEVVDFQNVSRGNIEMLDIFCALSPRAFGLIPATSSGLDNDHNLESSVGGPNIPNGAGETLYDLSETCSEEFCSPLSTLSIDNVAFTTDSGEEYYSAYPSVETGEPEPDGEDLWSTIEDMDSDTSESDIEIDCDFFSRSNSEVNSPFHFSPSLMENSSKSSMNDSLGETSDTTMNTSLDHEERWPSFIAFPTTSKENESTRTHKSGSVRISDSLGDLSTVCADEVETDCSSPLSCSNSFMRTQSDTLTRFTYQSVSNPNLSSCCKYQSSPLELGRFFTLRTCTSETALALPSRYES